MGTFLNTVTEENHENGGEVYLVFSDVSTK